MDRPSPTRSTPPTTGTSRPLRSITPLTKQWTVQLPASPSYPVVVGNVVYVTAGSSLYAIDLSTGNTLWTKSVGGTYGTLGPAYDGGQLFVANSSGNLSAVNPADGTTVWADALNTYGQWSFSSAPTAAAGHVYVGGAGSGGTLYALSDAPVRSTGTPKLRTAMTAPQPWAQAASMSVTPATRTTTSIRPLAVLFGTTRPRVRAVAEQPPWSGTAISMESTASPAT